MLYVLALVILLAAIIVVYSIRVVSAFFKAMKAHRAHARDPEAQAEEAPPKPNLRDIAREITVAMFPPREQQPHVPMHRRSSAEMMRPSAYGMAASAVHRVETRDQELPTYQESHNMPKPPAAIYAASTAHPTATRQEADEASAPGTTSAALGTAGIPSPSSAPPPEYQETPVVRVI